ncbi:hypothetical protein JP74_21965 [Devosia sp. 17-2-E-8]|nr:hypothetical protein JP74_21965 [Devosia sp. 17-2-E-8]
MEPLRQIAAVSLSGLTPAMPPTGMPICEMVDPRDLWVDPSYQRAVGERGIKQVVHHREVARMKKAKPSEITYAQASAELPAAEAAMQAESVEYTRAYGECIETLHRLYGVMAREKARALVAKHRYTALRKIVDKGDGEGKESVVYKLVLIENPFATLGLLDAVENGEITSHSQGSGGDDAAVTLQLAAINQTLLVGGLAKVSTKTEAQFLAAAHYCHLYERSQIGGARATDYSQVRVDTSGPQQDQISASQDDARAELMDAQRALGPEATAIVDQVVVYGGSVRTLAKRLGCGEGGQGRKRAERRLLQALDVLVDHFNLMPPETPRRRSWNDGSRAVIVDEEVKGQP